MKILSWLARIYMVHFDLFIVCFRQRSRDEAEKKKIAERNGFVTAQPLVRRTIATATV